MFLILFLTIIMSSCSTTDKSQIPLGVGTRPDSMGTMYTQVVDQIPTISNNPSELRPGNILYLRNSIDKKLNSQFRVNHKGYLNLPYNQQIKASGMSIKELKKVLLNRYNSYFPNNIDLKAWLRKKKSYYVNIQGLVNEPGLHLVYEDQSLEEMLVEAGGITDGAVNKIIKVSRDNTEYSVDFGEYLRKPQDRTRAIWQGGEKVIVLNKEVKGRKLSPRHPDGISLIGEVRRPGTYVFREDKDLYYYLLLADGPARSTNLNEIMLVRNGETSVHQFSIDVPSNLPRLQKNDVLIFQAHRESTFERTMRMATNFTALIASLISIVLVSL